MSHNPQTRSKTRGGRSDSLDHDVRCRIKITTHPSMNIITYLEPLDITIYQLLQVYKVNHLKQQLVNELSQFKCVLDALPKPPCCMISATLTGTRREKLKNIIQILNKFSGYCEECTVSRKTFKILKDRDFLFTVIANRGIEIDIVYCKNDSIEWAVNLRSWSEEQKQYLMLFLDSAHQTKYELELNGNKIRIFTNPQTIGLIHDACCNIGIDGKDKGDYDRIHRSTSNETHVNTNIGNGKDGLHNNNSQWQSPSSPSTEPGDRCACNNSQWQPTSSSNTESENIYAQKDSQWQPSSSSSTGPENTNAHDNSHGQSLCSSNTKPEERYTRNNSQWHTTSSSNTEPEDRSVNNNPQGHSMSSQNTEPEDRYGNLNSEGQSMSCSNREPGDIYAHNNSQGQPTLNSNVDPGDRYVNNDSQWQSPSSSNTETGDMTIHDKTNVPSTTLLEACDGAVPGPVHGNVRIIPDRAVQLGDSRGVLYHPGNGQDADLGGNTDEKGDNGTGTHTEDKCRLSSTSQDTTNYKNKDRYDVNRIDLIYLKLFTKRKPILDKILYCFSQSGYNQRLRFNEDGSTEPSLNNEEFFALNVAIIKFLDIKRVSLKQYDLPDGWVDSMNIIENSIVVEKQETYIFIVGLKDIVQRVLLNLRQYTRKGGVSTDDLRGEDINEAVEGTEYLGPYSIGINCPLDCEYICKEGDHLLYELQKTYSCFIDIQPLVTGTKEIHFANWIYNSKGAGHIEIPLIIGDHRTLPDQSDILVLEQNQTDQSYESGQQSSDNLAHYRIMPDHSKRHLEDRVKNGRYKTLILLMDKTTKKETVSFFYRACKNLTKRIYLPMKSRPQVNCYLLQTLFEKGELKYGGQDTLEDVQHHQPCKGHYIEMKIGQINNQKVDVIVDVVESQTLPHRYDIKTVKVSDKPVQYKIELNVPPYRFDSSSPIIRVALMVNACLREVSEKKLASIAFPVLCMGHVGYPVNLVAKSMMETIDEFFKFHNDTSLCHVMIVIHEHGTRSKEVFCAENLSRIKEGRMAGDTIHRVNIEIAGDKLKKKKIERAIYNIIQKKEIPVTVDDVSSKRREENMASIRSCAIEKRHGSHESRCVIIEYTAKELGMANVKNVLVPNLKAEIQPLCVVSPFQDNIYKAFLAFGNKKVKDEACALIKKKYETFKFIDMPASQEVLTPVIHRVNVHIKGCNALKKGLQEASGVYTMSTNGEVFIEGCPQQIELAKIMLQEKYGKKYNQNTGLQPVQVEPCSVKTYKFRALKCLFGQDKMKKICGDVKEADGETHFTLPKDSKDKLVEDLKDLMNKLYHEEIDVNGDKIEEAKRYSTNHAHMDTVYVEFDTKTSSIHILGEDYVEVELVSHQAKIAVGIIKFTNKKQQRTRTDEYTPTTPPVSHEAKVAVGILKLTNKKQQRTRTDEYTPTPTAVKLAPPLIQEHIFYTKCKHLTVCVKQSDITILDIEVIVNFANEMMRHVGEVARFIATAGGDELDRQCKRYIDDNGQLPVTGICKTTGGNMICKQVYHAVGPCWSDYSNKSACEDDLCKTIVRCLVEADQDGFQSIAIPSISSAIFGVPKNICAHMYAKAVKSFDAVYPVSNLREIYFVDLLDGMVSMVQTGFDMFFTEEDDDDLIKEEIERFIKEITCKAAVQQPEREITNNKPHITCTLHSIITLHIYQAALLSTKTDSVTTWEDTKMTNFKASAKKIINAAGGDYKEERSKVRSDGGFKAGSVLITSAGCLPYQHIYHLISSIKPGRKEIDVLLDNLVKEISMTTDASFTIDIGNIDADVLFTSLVNLFKTAKPSTLKEIHLVADSEDKIKKLQINYEDYIKQLGGIVKISDTKCPICLDEITDIKALPCGHTFCAECVDAAIEKNPVCPICHINAYGEIQTGYQPDGKMEHNILHTHLEGFPHCDTTEILYSFNDGIQSANHPRPGYPFKGKTETAYLPDNTEGRVILKLLKLAFDRRLIFTVSSGVTSSPGREFVTWSNIPHKTRQDGGPESNGYPDPAYLTQVRKALYTRGVVIVRRDSTGPVDRNSEYLAQNSETSKPKRTDLLPSDPICKENFKDADELIEELQRYQNTEITVKADIRFSLEDLRSLDGKNWLHDKIIDAYLSLLSEDEKQHGNNIYVIPTYIAALMLEEHYDQCMSSLENVNLNDYTWIFMPVNTRHHWVLLAANITQGRVSLLDSLQYGDTDVVDRWRKFMKFRAEKTGELNINWVECNDWVSSKQGDLASCGPFVLLNALAISRNVKTQCFNNEHAKLMRKLVYHRITSPEKLVAANSGIKEDERR